jgi:hypothetical protein
MPAVVIQFEGAFVRRPTLARYVTDDVGTVDRDEFDATLVVIDASFDVTNHGPGPALFSVDVISDYETQALLLVVTSTEHHGQKFAGNKMVQLASEPIVIPAPGQANQAIITVRILTNGRELFSHISGTVYAKVRFRWSAYTDRDVYDSASLDLRAGAHTGESGVVNDALLRRLVSQPSDSAQRSDLLLPDDRYYRTPS